MQDESPSHAEQVALFRYGLIADLIHLRPGGGRAGRYGRYVKLREKAAAAYTIPGSRRTRVAVEAIRGWLHDYREHGFEGLKPKPRADVGTTRHIPQHVADLLVALKDEHRDWTIPTVVAEARRMAAAGEADVPEDLALPTSTVHRLLTRAGVMDKPKESPTTKDRRRFAYDRAGELWMSDVMHGPAVVVDGRRKRKAYLVALLDDATRIVPFCAFTLSENTAAFLPVLEQGVMRRGIPKRLYVDNGSAYRSHHLALVCARLGITLVHARPHSPQGKGKQERWFRTVRMQFCATLREGDLASLEVLNRKLWAWVEGEYHQSPHKGLDGKTPFDAWAMSSGDVRLPGPELDLREMFLFAEAQGARRPHGQPRRRGVRGRRGARRRDGDLALQPLQARSSHRRLASGQEDPRPPSASTRTPTASCDGRVPIGWIHPSHPTHPPRRCACVTSARATTTRSATDVPQALRPHGLPPRQRHPRRRDVPLGRARRGGRAPRHLVDMRGIGLITGDSGSGKSSACRRLEARLHTGLYKVVYVPLSTDNPMDMYKTIAWEFGLPVERSRAALYRQIRTEVTRLCTESRTRPVLIIDEAHNLRSDVLEELRLLTNYAMDSDNRLCLLLSGQTELRRRIAMAVHEPLNQRTVVRYHMPPLGRDEVPAYLAHLLRRGRLRNAPVRPRRRRGAVPSRAGAAPQARALRPSRAPRGRRRQGQGRLPRARAGRAQGGIVMTGACPRAGPAHSPDPVPLLEVALALGVQLLVARPPDLLLPPDVPRIRAPPEWRAAQALVGIINAAFAVLADYTAARDAHAPCALRTADDDIPF